MGGEAGSAAALGGSEGGRVKSLGLVFQDEGKGCYASGETVAGHVLLEAAEPVALIALRLEALGRATTSWGPSAGSAAPASASEVEYLNLRLNLREAPAGEQNDSPEVLVTAGTLGRGRACRCPSARWASAGSSGVGFTLAGHAQVTMPAPHTHTHTSQHRGDPARWLHPST